MHWAVAFCPAFKLNICNSITKHIEKSIISKEMVPNPENTIGMTIGKKSSTKEIHFIDDFYFYNVNLFRFYLLTLHEIFNLPVSIQLNNWLIQSTHAIYFILLLIRRYKL